MSNYAHTTLIGHIGKDPVTRQLASGETVTSFSIATNSKRGQKEFVTWWNCSVWGRRGEPIPKYLKRGDPILVSGEPVLRPYTLDGVEKLALDVDVRDWAFVGKNDPAPPTPAPAPAYSTQDAAPPAAYEDDIPF